ncbi:DUF2993 domain-containing protein [Streptomyces sp. NPDC059169]|uniref:LmeA family phospholipid-binding protein n=1 Tax=unclassified Streptomyces TaxID=2593676 RepID=UPI0036C8EFF1
MPSRKENDASHWSSWRPDLRLAAASVLMKLAVATVVCAALLVASDRLAVAYAEKKVEEAIQGSPHLAARPEVDIAGFPFLIQVLGRRIDRVDVTVPDVAADKVSLAEVHASAKDVRIVGDLPTALKGAVVDRIDGDVRLSFDDLDRELGTSRIKFTDAGAEAIRIAGTLPVAGHKVAVRTEAHVRRQGDRTVSTTVEDMVLDVPGLFTYRPGKGPSRSGLHLHAQAAARIGREAARVKALFAVPSVVKRLGIPREHIDRALRSEEELNRLTGSPRFLQQLMGVNLVDLVVDHP